MENKGNFLAGLAIMVGLVFLGLCIPKAVNVMNANKRNVSVRGLCEREVQADKVIWPIQYSAAGDDLASLLAEVERGNATIKEFLLAGGITEEEITSSAPSISDKFTQEYGYNDRRYRYVVKSTVTLCTGKVNEVLALMKDQSSLLKKGLLLSNDWESKPSFSFEGLNDVKPEMIEEATKNAREVAQKFADDSDSKLGKIRDASQGYFTIEDRDANTPYIKKVRVVTNVNYGLSR